MDDGGMSWFCNIVQKFEDFLSDVDDVVQQELESVTYQLQNAVKFCRDLAEGDLPISLEKTEKEPASEIDVEDSDSSKILSDENDCEKESWNKIHLHCTSSVEPMDVIQSNRCVDTKVCEKSETMDIENLLKEKLFQHEPSVAVSVEEEESNNLEEDKQLQHEMTEAVSPKEEEVKNIEDVSSHISSPAPSSHSDSYSESCEILPLAVKMTPASAESPDDSITVGTSNNKADHLQDQHRMFEEIIEEYLKARTMPITRPQEAHISYLRRVQPHYSMMKTITRNLDGILREEENLGSPMISTEEHDQLCDSDWVIV